VDDVTVVVRVDVTVLALVVKVIVTVIVSGATTWSAPVSGWLVADCTVQFTMDPTVKPLKAMESPVVVWLTPFTATDHSAPWGSPVSMNTTVPVSTTKLAVSEMGPFIVNGAAALGPVYDPDPVPVQETNAMKTEGLTLAFSSSLAPASYHPDDGLSVMPEAVDATLTVRSYCVTNATAWVVGPVTVSWPLDTGAM